MACLLKCPCSPDWMSHPQMPDNSHWSPPHSPPWRPPHPLSALCSPGRCGSPGEACHSLIFGAWHPDRRGCVWGVSDHSAWWIYSASQLPSPHLWRSLACWDQERSPCWRCLNHRSSGSSNDWIHSLLGRWDDHCWRVWSCFQPGGDLVDSLYAGSWSVLLRCCQTPPADRWWMHLWVAGFLERWSMRRTNTFTLNIQESLLPEVDGDSPDTLGCSTFNFSLNIPGWKLNEMNWNSCLINFR